jgi:hypothetical protein
MTTAADRNDLMPAQEKLEWVTPKISLMDAGDTDGNKVSVFGIELNTNKRGPS